MSMKNFLDECDGKEEMPELVLERAMSVPVELPWFQQEKNLPSI